MLKTGRFCAVGGAGGAAMGPELGRGPSARWICSKKGSFFFARSSRSPEFGRNSLLQALLFLEVSSLPLV